MAEDVSSVDFFRDPRLTDDPFPLYEALRARCPVSRENHYGVTMVTGWQEAVDVYNDAETFSSCISVSGPFPGFPVPLEGDDVTDTIAQHRDELPFSDQLPTLDPPVHTNHRGLLMRLITPKRLKENEDAMWQLADDILDQYLANGEGEFIDGFAGPTSALGIDPIEDQRLAGGLAWSYGEAPTLLMLIYVMHRWFRDDTAQAVAADRRADAHGDPELDAYNDYLTRLHQKDT